MKFANSKLLDHLQRWLTTQAPNSSSDALLVERLACHDEAAFTALVQRYGPMVLRVCRRQLGDDHDVEDAFQGTFLVLARKAPAIRKRESVGAWLHGVAYRVAREIRKPRQPAEASHLDQCAAPGLRDEASWRETVALLDEELYRLPEKYRVPLVLCHLQGQRQADVCRQLGWSLRTLEYRLAQGRELLRQRLVRRGVEWSVVVLALELSESAVPAALVTTTVRAASAFAAGKTALAGECSARAVVLAEGVLRTMVTGKWKLAAALLLAGMALGGGGVLLRSAAVADPRATNGAAQPEDRSPGAGKAVDRYGDPLPPGAVARLGTIRFRPGGDTTVLAFAKDGKTVASIGSNGVRVWDAATGREVRQFDSFDDLLKTDAFAVSAPDLTADGKIRIVKDYAGISLRDAATGQDIRKLEGSDFPNTIVLSPDGKTLACEHGHSGSFTRSGYSSVGLWDLASGKQLTVFAFESGIGRFGGIRFSPDGKTLVSRKSDGTVFFWDVVSTKEIHKLKVASFLFNSAPIVFAPDGKTFATEIEDNAIGLWEMGTWKKLRQCQGHHAGIASLAISPDGQTLASASKDHTVRVWDLATGKEREEFGGHQHAITTCIYSADGKVLTSRSEDGTIRQWDPASGKELFQFKGHKRWTQMAVFTPNAQALLVIEENAIREYDVVTNKELRRFPHQHVHRLAISPDGRIIASNSGSEIYLWDLITGKQLRALAGHEVGVEGGLAFSPDGKTLASSGNKRTDNERVIAEVRLWDVATGKELGKFAVGRQVPVALAFSADGNMLVPGTSVLGGRWNDPSSLEAAPLEVWEIATRKKRCRFQAAHSITAIAFAPDGETVASAGADSIRVWDVFTGVERAHFRGHRAPVNALVFSPDGQTLASASSDTTVLIWDTRRDRRPHAAAPAAKELDALYATLASDDAAEAFRAMGTLCRSPGQTISWLHEHLKPAAIDARRLDQLIADLDSAKFEVRQHAEQELTKLHGLAAPALQKALDDPPPLEMKQRLERLLDKVSSAQPPPSDVLRAVRAVEVLEHIGSADAKQLLEELARGAAGAWQTHAAHSALERWRRRAAAETDR